MSSRGWIPDPGFPSAVDYDSAVEHADAITEYVLSSFRKEKMNAEPSQTLKRKAKFFGIAYSSAISEGRWVLSDDDLEWAVYIGSDDPSEHKYETFIPSLRQWFTRHGWLKVDLSYLFSKNWDREYDIIVHPALPEVDEILDAAGNLTVVSTDTIEQTLLDAEPSLESQIVEIDYDEGEESSEIIEIDAAKAAVETAFASEGWLSVEATDAPARVWVDPDKLYERIHSYMSDKTKISRVELHEEILSIIRSADVELESGVTISSRKIIEKFEKQLREQNWQSLVLEKGTTWYANAEKYGVALESKLDQHNEILDRPIKYSDEALAEVRSFLDGNYYELIKNDCYNSIELDEMIKTIGYHIDAAEKLEEIRKAKREKLSGELFRPSVEGD